MRPYHTSSVRQVVPPKSRYTATLLSTPGFQDARCDISNIDNENDNAASPTSNNNVDAATTTTTTTNINPNPNPTTSKRNTIG